MVLSVEEPKGQRDRMGRLCNGCWGNDERTGGAGRDGLDYTGRLNRNANVPSQRQSSLTDAQFLYDHMLG